MSDKVLISSYLGINEYAHFNADRPDDLIYETVQDCEPVMQQVKIDRDAPVGKDWRLAARIPLSFLDGAAREGWLLDHNKWTKFLNDPDNRAFRVWNGRLGKSRQI